MVSFSVVTDTVYTLPPQLEVGEVKKAQVTIVVDDRETHLSKDLSAVEVVELQKRGHRLTTAAPSPGEWLKAFNEAEEPIVAIAVSSKLSASYNNALIAARMSRKEVHVVDSMSATIGQGLVVYRALLLSGKGEEVELAVKELQDVAKRVRIYLSVGSMEYLARSGRVPWIAGKLGEFLGLHPILTVEDGLIKKHSVVRSGVPERLASLVREPEGPVIVGKVEPLKEADELYALLKERGYEVYDVFTCPDIVVHVGPGSYGVAYIERPSKNTSGEKK